MRRLLLLEAMIAPETVHGKSLIQALNGQKCAKMTHLRSRTR
jgi:hypothetical protein